VSWYDNEYGYTCNMLRVVQHVGKVRSSPVRLSGAQSGAQRLRLLAAAGRWRRERFGKPGVCQFFPSSLNIGVVSMSVIKLTDLDLPASVC
jgi:hypothetical protein